MNFHKSVLLQETVDALIIEKGKRYIDATLGGGGHSKAILEKGGLVLGIDADLEAIEFVNENLKSQISNLKLKTVKGNFKDIDNIAKENGFGEVSGIIFDLGVSSNQIDNSYRGFSYLKNGPLDMRMDQELSLKASDLINVLGKDELINLFSSLGGEHGAKDIANRIIKKRKEKPIETTDELVRLLARSYKVSANNEFARSKSSKKVFQALRIAVNDELDNLETAINKAIELLNNNGRLAVITFHSLEDRLIKKAFAGFEEKGKGKVITKKPIYPLEKEIKENKRSKSAKLRVFEKK